MFKPAAWWINPNTWNFTGKKLLEKRLKPYVQTASKKFMDQAPLYLDFLPAFISVIYEAARDVPVTMIFSDSSWGDDHVFFFCIVLTLRLTLTGFCEKCVLKIQNTAESPQIYKFFILEQSYRSKSYFPPFSTEKILHLRQVEKPTIPSVLPKNPTQRFLL